MSRNQRTLSGALALGFVLICVPLLLVATQSEWYGARSIEDVRSIASQLSAMSIGIAFVHVFVWIAWLALLRLAAVEALRPTLESGLANRVWTRLAFGTGIIGLSNFGAGSELGLSLELDELEAPASSHSETIQGFEAPIVNHVTVLGDSWISLADKYLGDPYRWADLRELNLGREMPGGTTISDSSVSIMPGWILQVPETTDRLVAKQKLAELPASSYEREADVVFAGLGAAGVLIAQQLLKWVRRRRSVAAKARPQGFYISPTSRQASATEAALIVRAEDIVDPQRLIQTDRTCSVQDWPEEKHFKGDSLSFSVDATRVCDLSITPRISIHGNTSLQTQFLSSAVLQLRATSDEQEILLSETVASLIPSFGCPIWTGDTPPESSVLVMDATDLSGSGASTSHQGPMLVLGVVDDDSFVKVNLDSSPQEISQVSTPAAKYLSKWIEAEELKPHPISLATNLKERDINLFVMGEVRSSLGSDLSAQQLSLLAYLAINGPTPKALLKEALWNGKTVSDKRFLNVISDLRKSVGKKVLPDARVGFYRVCGVHTDMDFLRALWKSADVCDIESLVSGLNLVSGQPFKVSGRRHWTWITDHSFVSAEAEALVADLATVASGRLQAQGRSKESLEVLYNAIDAVPMDRRLFDTLEQLLIELGRFGAAKKLRSSWIKSESEALSDLNELVLDDMGSLNGVDSLYEVDSIGSGTPADLSMRPW